MHILVVLSILHAFVDASCAAMVINYYRSNTVVIENLAPLIILYDTIAFGMQPIIGFFADSTKKPILIAGSGILLLVLGMTLGDYFPVFAICLMGLGNAVFHIGGGIVSLTYKYNKAYYPGLFVAPGAIGLFCGTWLGKNEYYSPIVFVLVLLIISSLLIKREIIYDAAPAGLKTFQIQTRLTSMAILFFLISITIRSLIGSGIAISWKSDINLMFALVIGIASGKFAGGWLGDKFGWMITAVLSLTLSAILLSFDTNQPIWIIGGLFMFNITMPIAMVAIAGLMPGREGLAFGLNCLALLIGTSLKLYDNSFSISGISVPCVILISAVSMLIGLHLYNRILEKNNSG